MPRQNQADVGAIHESGTTAGAPRCPNNAVQSTPTTKPLKSAGATPEAGAICRLSWIVVTAQSTTYPAHTTATSFPTVTSVRPTAAILPMDTSSAPSGISMASARPSKASPGASLASSKLPEPFAYLVHGSTAPTLVLSLVLIPPENGSDNLEPVFLLHLAASFCFDAGPALQTAETPA